MYEWLATPTPLATRILAAAPPLWVIAAAAWWLGQPLPRELGPTAQAMNDQLDAHPPKVVLIGNSHLARSVDPAQLAVGLGLQPDEVQVLFQVSSRPAVWYALLEGRVYANGHEPDAVVIVEPLKGLSSTAVSGKAQQQLEEQADPADPVIARKVYGREAAERGAWRNAAVRRGQLRDGLIDGARDLVVGLLFADERPEGVRQAGREVAEPALERLFEAENLWDDGGRQRVIPVVEAGAELPPPSSEAVEAGTGIESTFIPDLV